MNDGISIIICCYNSAQRIAETISYLAGQNISYDVSFEVIIVNNNSTDNTVEIAENELRKSDSLKEYKIINENVPGLSNARKAGINESKYNIIIFCDDDNWLDNRYLDTAYSIMKNFPTVGAAGGQSTAVSNIDFPDWFDQYNYAYAVGQQSNLTGFVTERGFIWGAGLIVRKSILLDAEKLGFKSILTGRNGKQILAGDDSEICKWIILMGYELYYSENLRFKHFISPERLNENYRLKMFDGFSKSTHWLKKYDQLIDIYKRDRSKIENFFCALYLLAFKRHEFPRTYLQFLLGPYLKISSYDDFQFIKRHHKLLYK